MRLVASEVARVLGGRLVGPDATGGGAGFDSRTLAGGEMFAAVRAELDLRLQPTLGLLEALAAGTPATPTT